jgi:DNA-binding Xre family transcriptional regulator
MIICRLKRILKRKGWTRYKLQKESGITFPTIYAYYENRTQKYSAVVMNRMCATLGCTPGDLLKWKPDEMKKTHSK